ncbi:MAG: hypothetical protein KBH23_06140 [Bacteroidaceae bacterium]|nr:hypothetical protein [Bacteroidaceae bacterium]
MKYLPHNKIKQWFSCIFFIAMISIGILTACNKSQKKQIPGAPSIKGTEETILTNSLKNYSFFTDSDFTALKEKDAEQWKLVTDLLSIYFQTRYEQDTKLGEIKLPIEIITQRLAKEPNLWKRAKGSTEVVHFQELTEQAKQLANFPTSSNYEKYCQKALLDFFDLYLTQKANKGTYEYPKSKSLNTALIQENTAWNDLLEAEAKVGEALLQINSLDSFHQLGSKEAQFLASLQKRRSNSDRETYFALTSPSYNPNFSGYVTWAETKSEYAKLATRIQQQYQTKPTPCRNLINALRIEQNTWFSLIKTRDAVQKLLYGNAQNVYSSNSRKLKSEHIKDLQTTFERHFQ